MLSRREMTTRVVYAAALSKVSRPNAERMSSGLHAADSR